MGAGKDRSANYLAGLLGIPHVSGSEVVKNMLRAAELPVTKSSARGFSIFLRAQFGPDIIISRVLSSVKGPGVITSGFRTYVEAQIIKEHGGVILYIDASAHIRHERITSRSRRGDPSTSNEFLNFDALERNGDQASDESLEDIKRIADVVIENEGTIDELQSRLRSLC